MTSRPIVNPRLYTFTSTASTVSFLARALLVHDTSRGLDIRRELLGRDPIEGVPRGVGKTAVDNLVLLCLPLFCQE